MDIKAIVLREILWLGGIAIVAGIIVAIVPQPPETLWMKPFIQRQTPRTRLFDVPPLDSGTWFFLIFVGLFVLTVLIRVILRFIR